MVKVFDEELGGLKADFMKLGALVGEAISSSGQSFINHDVDSAQQVITNDPKINDLQIELEKRSFEIMALYQPVTTDLREVVSILKGVTDLERAGDHARNVARSTVKIKGQKRLPEVEEIIATMANEVSKEFNECISAYARADQVSAKETVKIFADEINDLYNGAASPSYQAMAAHPDIVNSGVLYINVAKDLSRISDYSTNICEWTIYLATGEIVELS